MSMALADEGVKDKAKLKAQMIDTLKATHAKAYASRLSSEDKNWAREVASALGPDATYDDPPPDAVATAE